MKSKKKILISVISLCFVLAIGLGIAGYNYNQKYDTETMLANMETLTFSDMTKLTQQTLIVCYNSNTNDFKVEEAGLVNQDSIGNIHILTYESAKYTERAYNIYQENDDIILCEYDNVLSIAELTDEELKKLKEQQREDIENSKTTPIMYDEDIETSSIIYDEILNELHSSVESSDDKDIKIAVIDSGAPSNYTGYNAFNGSTDITDDNGHGTRMINIIENQLRKDFQGQYAIIPIKVANDNGLASVSALIRAFEYLADKDIDAINISMSSLNTTQSDILEDYITKFSDHGIQVIVSAGNNSDNVMKYSPAKFEAAITVGSSTKDGKIQDFSNYGKSIDYLVESNSTSEAASITTSLYVRSLLEEKNFGATLKNSGIVYEYSYNDNGEYEIFECNNTDDLVYNACGCGGATPPSTGQATNTSVPATGYLKDNGRIALTLGLYISNPYKVHDHLRKNGRTNDGGKFYIAESYSYHPTLRYLTEITFTNCQDKSTKYSTVEIYKTDIKKSYTDIIINSRINTESKYVNMWSYSDFEHEAYWSLSWKYYSTSDIYTDLDNYSKPPGYPAVSYIYEDPVFYEKLNNGSWAVCAQDEYYYWKDYASGDTIHYKAYSKIADKYTDEKTYTFPTYTLKLNTNGGSVTNSSYQMYYKKTNNRTVNIPTRNGYEFLGWYTTTTGGTKVFDKYGNAVNDGTYWKSDNTWGVYSEVTLYAKWQPCTVTVKFNKNDGSSATYTEIYTYNVSNQTFGMNLTQRAVLGFCGWTRTGYGIVGWSESSTATPSTSGLYGVYCTVSNSWISTRVGTTVNLYAVWKPKALTVNYKSNNGNDHTYTETYYYGTNGQKLAYKYTGTEIAGGFGAFTKTGYSFVGWNEKSNASYSESLYTRNQDVGWSWINSKVGDQFSNSLNLYCIWKPNTYKAVFDKQKGTGGTDSVDSVYDSSTRDDVTIPTRTGYNFGGYYTQKAGKGTQWWDADGKSIANTWKAASDFTFYAYWIPVTAEVTFYRNLDSSDTVTNKQTFTYDVTGQKFASTGWTKTGYKFNGYSTDRNATSGPYSLNNSVSNDWILAHVNGISLYTTWKPLEYKVVYNANGGTGSLTETWIYNTAHETYNNAIGKKFQKTGYYIDYWYTTSDSCNYGSDAQFKAGGGYSGSKAISTNTAKYTNLITPDKDGDTITLYAHWAPIRYKITFGNDTTNTGHGEVYTTSMFLGLYSYGNTYNVPTTVFERSNKFGESEFLGFSLKNGDTSLKPLLCNVDSPDDIRTTSNVRFTQGIFSSSKTTEGTTYANYFRYLPIGDIQSFALYAVYNDCPGISPVDAYYNMDTVKGAAVLGTNPATASTTELESKLLSINAKTIYDRESGTTAVLTDSSHYYCEVLQLTTMQNQNVVTSYEIKYTITDKRGLKYTQSAMLYSGHTVDIKVN